MTRDEALHRLRVTLAPISDDALRDRIYRAAVEFAHAGAQETLDECRRVISRNLGVTFEEGSR